MKRKFIWLAVSCLMALSLVLASCGPAVTEEEEEVVTEEEEEVVTEEEEEVVTEEEEEEEEWVVNAAGKLVEKPQYGGTLIVMREAENTFDPAFYHERWVADMAYDVMFLRGDRLRGPGGTGEYMYMDYAPLDFTRPSLAESFEHLDFITTIIHLRQGVYFQDKYPTYGREMDSDDFIFTWNRIRTNTKSPYYMPPETAEENTTRMYKYPTDDDPTGKYTLKYVVAKPAIVWWQEFWRVKIVPREVGHYEYYPDDPDRVLRVVDDIDLEDWRNQNGTGAFMMVDQVIGSSITLDRNPNYFREDPLFPENKLPYVDSIVQLIMPDIAIRLSALRTGQLDWIQRIPRLEGMSLEVTNPELDFSKVYDAYSPHILYNAQRFPGNDIMLRQALSLAVNYDEIVEDYYDGDASIVRVPFYPHWTVEATAREDLPREPISNAVNPNVPESPVSAYELFSYNPEKAREILVDAGYPEGFTFSLLVRQHEIEQASLFQEYFEAIGVTMELETVETATLESMIFAADNPIESAFLRSWTAGDPTTFFRYFYAVGHLYNYSDITDPYIDERNDLAGVTLDLEEQSQILRDLGVYVIEQAWTISFPASITYNFWQPWVKNYFAGEQSIQVYGTLPVAWIWIDQELKAELGR